MSIFMYTKLSTMAVVEVDCLSTACQFVSKPVDFITSSLGRLKLNLTVCNKILMINWTQQYLVEW